MKLLEARKINATFCATHMQMNRIFLKDKLSALVKMKCLTNFNRLMPGAYFKVTYT